MHFQQMHRQRATWDLPTTKLLLDLYIAEKDKCNFTQKGLTREGWKNVYRELSNSGFSYTNRQVSNELGSLKDKFNTWKTRNNRTGLERDPSTGRVVGDDEGLDSNEDTQEEPHDGSQDEVIDATMHRPVRLLHFILLTA